MNQRSPSLRPNVRSGGGLRLASLPKLRFSMLLLGLVLAALLPALAFEGIAARQAVAERQVAIEEGPRGTARSLSLVLDQEIDRHFGIVRGLAPAEALDGPQPDLARFEAQARRVTATFGTTAVLLDAASLRQLVDTALPPGTPAEAMAAAGFRSVAEMRRPVVTDLMTSPEAAEPLVCVAVPVVRSSRIRFLLAVRLDPEAFRHLLAAQDLPAGSFAAVTDGRGVVVARSDALHARLLGQQIPRENSRRLAAAPSGTYRAVALDGAEQVFGFYRLGNARDWAVVAAQPAATIDAAWRGPVLTLAAGGILALAFCGVLAVVAARGVLVPIGRLEAYARELAEGDRPSQIVSVVVIPPARLVELEALRRGFAAAEAALAGREVRLRTVLDHMPVGVSLAEAPSGRISFSNPRLDAVLGHRVITAADVADYRQWEARHEDGRRVPAASTTARTARRAIASASTSPTVTQWKRR